MTHSYQDNKIYVTRIGICAVSQVLMKDIVTPVPQEEVKAVIRKCLEQAAQINYQHITDYAREEGDLHCPLLSQHYDFKALNHARIWTGRELLYFFFSLLPSIWINLMHKLWSIFE